MWAIALRIHSFSNILCVRHSLVHIFITCVRSKIINLRSSSKIINRNSSNRTYFVVVVIRSS